MRKFELIYYTVARLFLRQDLDSLFQKINLLNKHFCQEQNIFEMAAQLAMTMLKGSMRHHNHCKPSKSYYTV